MAEALSHPEHGYYIKQNPLGMGGDFITAPEISQVFGELIGIWCAHQWQQMGCPDDFTLVELGAGRGTLMADLLRGTKHIPEFHSSFAVNMVETSPVLKRVQQEALKNVHPRITWSDKFKNQKKKPIIVIANEFVDA